MQLCEAITQEEVKAEAREEAGEEAAREDEEDPTQILTEARRLQ